MRCLTLTLAAVLLMPLAGAASAACVTIGGGQASLCASSVLAGQGTNTYGPDNLADEDMTTAWCEGAGGTGVGQRISLTVHGGGRVDHLLLANGYQKSGRTYERNGRLRDVLVRIAGLADRQYTLQDRAGWQRLDLPTPSGAQKIELEIASVYPGSKWTDTCVSGLRIGQADAGPALQPSPAKDGPLPKWLE